MPRSKSRKKIYFYLFILLLLSSTFNFNIISKFNKLNLINHIKITGLSEIEKSELENKLTIFIKKNIFLISKEEVDVILKNNNYIDSYKIKKVFPSKLLVSIKKTKFIGRTILDGKKYYIDKNGKLTQLSLVKKEFNLPQVFGSFKVKDFIKLQEILYLNGFNLNEINKYYYFKSDRWDIKNKDSVTIKLPSKNIEKSLKNYKSLLKSNKIIQGQLIDLRMKNKIIFTDAKK